MKKRCDGETVTGHDEKGAPGPRRLLLLARTNCSPWFPMTFYSISLSQSIILSRLYILCRCCGKRNATYAQSALFPAIALFARFPLNECHHAIGRNPTSFSKLTENHLQVLRRNLVRSTNIVQDTFQAFERNSLRLGTLGSTHNLLFETRGHFLRITIEKN